MMETANMPARQPADALQATITRLLLAQMAAVWIVFGVIWIFRRASLAGGIRFVSLIMPILVLANAALIALAAWWLGAGRRSAYAFALAVLSVNILLTFTDEFGIFDFITLMLDGVIAVILLITRPRYLHK
jgi:hypothetical protein